MEAWEDHDPAQPGRYEGEPAWVVYVWEEIILNGGADEEITLGAAPDGDGGVPYAIVKVDDEIRRRFPAIADEGPEVCLYQRDDGFVCRADAAEIRREADLEVCLYQEGGDEESETDGE